MAVAAAARTAAGAVPARGGAGLRCGPSARRRLAGASAAARLAAAAGPVPRRAASSQRQHADAGDDPMERRSAPQPLEPLAAALAAPAAAAVTRGQAGAAGSGWRRWSARPAQGGEARLHLAPARMIVLAAPVADRGELDLVERHGGMQSSIEVWISFFWLRATSASARTHSEPTELAGPDHDRRLGLADLLGDHVAVGDDAAAARRPTRRYSQAAFTASASTANES